MAGIKTFSFPVRIYFEDTDSGGVVYHSNYLKFMERARTEWLRSVGIDQHHLKHHDHIMFVVHRINQHFIVTINHLSKFNFARPYIFKLTFND